MTRIWRMRRSGWLAATVLGFAAPAVAEPPAPPPPHASQHPGLGADPGASSPPHVQRGVGSPWQPLTNAAPFHPGAMILLTDGTVMVQDQGPFNSGSNHWWRLAPDAFGSYVNGAWSAMASLPIGYQPLYFASAVLPDGRVIIEGGEYNKGKEVWTNKGSLYDP